MRVPETVDTVVALHADVTVQTRHLHVLHADILQCKRGCSSCCVDDLTVFAVEADHIRRHHGALLAGGAPHPAGACAFLDGDGACRIYEARPYVCRTQGLPLRWVEDDAELRDVCPLNDVGPPLETLPADDCWTLGPAEERLARLQVAAGTSPARVRLRDLFAGAAIAT